MLERMTNDWSPTDMEGVLRRSVEFHGDLRGSFGELWRASWTGDLGEEFTQANLSKSRAGTLRGLHFHRRQTDLWVILEGRAHVVLVDIRPHLAAHVDESPEHFAEVLEPGGSLIIPPGVAHGFWALEDVSLLYLVTNEYDGTDEGDLAWNDPLVAARWPGGEPLLSERDQRAPSLAETLRLSAGGEAP